MTQGSKKRVGSVDFAGASECTYPSIRVIVASKGASVAQKVAVLLGILALLSLFVPRRSASADKAPMAATSLKVARVPAKTKKSAALCGRLLLRLR